MEGAWTVATRIIDTGAAAGRRTKAVPTPHLQVQFCVDRLLGCLPVYREAARRRDTTRTSALQVEAVLVTYNEVLGVPVCTAWAEADASGAAWGSWHSFTLKVGRTGKDA